MICCSWIYFVPICVCMCNQMRLGGEFHHLHFARSYRECVCLLACVCVCVPPQFDHRASVGFPSNEILITFCYLDNNRAASPAQASYIYDNFCCFFFLLCLSLSPSLSLFFYWNHCWLKDVILISGGCVSIEGWKASEPCWFTGTDWNWKGEMVWNASWIRHSR